MQGDVAVVTGAGSGIGRAIAFGLAETGATVVAVDVDRSTVEATAAARPERMQPRNVDVADADAVNALADDVRASVGAVSVVVNAAGWDETAPFVEASTEFAQRI